MPLETNKPRRCATGIYKKIHAIVSLEKKNQAVVALVSTKKIHAIVPLEKNKPSRCYPAFS